MPMLRPLAFAAAVACLAGEGFAQQRDPGPRPERRERSELPESVLRAERQTGGEVLRAESMQRDGREVYRLKVLTPDGRVRIMRDDPHERRREAWRESRGEAGRAAFDDIRSQREERFREPRSLRPEPAPVSHPAELAVPETLPPAERGDRY
ncbi:PepSY domain-containing protein [Silanimonas lenta]|uniref:PepSY domain-containing protein n=1 Tax=Silanimonas lenta TaxID=265429 RepID=UPI0004069CD1|nr:PepSY domain-containing protein [Silanimonas lenta]